MLEVLTTVFDVGFFESSPDDAQLAAAFRRAQDQRPSTSVAIAAAGGGVATRGPQDGLRFSEGLRLASETFANGLTSA